MKYTAQFGYRINTLTQEYEKCYLYSHADIIYLDDNESKTAKDRFSEIDDMFINVKCFGVVGDGITDDTANLNAALASTYNIFLPVGTFLISGELNIPSNKKIIGSGKQSVIKLKGDAAYNILVSSNTENVVLRDFTLDGNKLEFTDRTLHTTCIQFTSVKNLILDNIYATGGLIEGIYLYLCENINMSNVSAIENGFPQQDASGIHLDTCTVANLNNIISRNNGFHGIIFSSMSNANVNNAICKDNGWDGLRIQYTSNYNNFNNIQSEGNVRGIYFTTDSNYNNCSNSHFNNNTGNGINFNVSAGNQFTNVFSSNNGGAGICTVANGDSMKGVNMSLLNNTGGQTDLNASSTVTLL